MLNEENATILLIDVQEKLIPAISDSEALVSSTAKLLAGAKVLGLPVIWCEQNPTRIGPTMPELTEHLEGFSPISKLCFSALKSEEVKAQLQATGRNQVIVTGIEAHICVSQTVQELLQEGYEVHVAADCISSRTAQNREIGLTKMLNAGAEITSVEAALFEMLGQAQGDKFKQILKIIK